jgi:hypothetical protein
MRTAGDNYGNVQGELQVARTQTDYNAEKCKIWQCKGFKYEDNKDLVQSFTPGQVVPIKFEVRAPHEGTANVSIVDTASNTIIGTPLISWDVYASPSLRTLVASAPSLVLVCSNISGTPDRSTRPTSPALISPSADPALVPQHLSAPRLPPPLPSLPRRPLQALLPRPLSPLPSLPPPPLSLPPWPPSSSPAASHPLHPAPQVVPLLPTVSVVARASLEPPDVFRATPARSRTTTTLSAFLVRTRYHPLLLPARPALPLSLSPRALPLQTPW